MKNFMLNNLTFISNGVASENYLLQYPIPGLDAPNYRSSSYSKPGDDGVVISSQFYDGRVITLTGIVYSPFNADDYETARRELAKACRINKDSNGNPIASRITFTTMANEDYFMDVYFDKPVFDYVDPMYSHFMITATCANPFIYSTGSFTTGNISVGVSGGYISPYTSPYITGSTTGGGGTINNVGNVATYPMVYFYGPLTNPQIQSTTVGKYMQLNYTLGSGDVATVDMANKTIVLNGSASLNSYKSTGSDWFNIQPGINSYTFTTGSSGDTGTVIVTGYPGYIGV